MAQHHVDEAEEDKSVDCIEIASKAHGLHLIMEMSCLHLLAGPDLERSDTALRHEAGENAGGFGRLDDIDVHRHTSVTFVSVADLLLSILRTLRFCLLYDLSVQIFQLGMRLASMTKEHHPLHRLSGPQPPGRGLALLAPGGRSCTASVRSRRKEGCRIARRWSVLT